MEGEERGIFGRARPRQIDLDRLENARGRTVKHENAIGEESRLQGAVGYEQSSGCLGSKSLRRRAVSSSKALNGSSSSTIAGSIAKARAKATRCRCPPESAKG